MFCIFRGESRRVSRLLRLDVGNSRWRTSVLFPAGCWKNSIDGAYGLAEKSQEEIVCKNVLQVMV